MVRRASEGACAKSGARAAAAAQAAVPSHVARTRAGTAPRRAPTCSTLSAVRRHIVIMEGMQSHGRAAATKGWQRRRQAWMCCSRQFAGHPHSCPSLLAIPCRCCRPSRWYLRSWRAWRRVLAPQAPPSAAVCAPPSAPPCRRLLLPSASSWALRQQGPPMVQTQWVATGKTQPTAGRSKTRARQQAAAGWPGKPVQAAPLLPDREAGRVTSQRQH
jgi:hypothetical protein